MTVPARAGAVSPRGALPRAGAVSPRDALLDRVIESVAAHGLGRRSLRDLAQQAGTSHRMLIHHFGSREGLFIAIVTEVEARQRAVFDDPSDDPVLALTAVWERLSDPSLWPFERLFFECYARGAQGEEPFAQLLPGLVDDWLDRFPPGPARDMSRMALALTRGLLLDLVGTQDRAGVDRAMAAMLDVLSAARQTRRQTRRQPAREQAG